MKARKIVALAMTAAMVGSVFAAPVFAEDAELLPGGGNKIIYCITPDPSNPYFKTVQDIATAKGEELGYEVKCQSHGDDAERLRIKEGAAYRFRSYDQPQENRNDIHKFVACCSYQSFDAKTFLHEITQHKHSEKRQCVR